MRPRPFPHPVWRRAAAGAVSRRAVLAWAACATGGLPLARAQAPGSCVLTPDSGEGPFYFDPSLVRSDITDDREGAPLTLALEVVRAGDCATLENARVDVWHADGIGLYSGYARQRGVGGVSTREAEGASYLRGTQITDAAGRVRFRTIFPSWYRGRTPHVHFKVFVGADEVVASQIFFPETVNERVLNGFEPYRRHAADRDTTNANDGFLTGRAEGVFCDATADDAGVDATVVIAVRPA